MSGKETGFGMDQALTTGVLIEGYVTDVMLP